MSQPKRLNAFLQDDADGIYCFYSDYAALAAENERLKAETVKQIEAALPPVEAYIAKLEAENARLRKAGDAVNAAYCMGNVEKWKEHLVVRDWLAAKGVQS